MGLYVVALCLPIIIAFGAVDKASLAHYFANVCKFAHDLNLQDSVVLALLADSTVEFYIRELNPWMFIGFIVISLYGYVIILLNIIYTVATFVNFLGKISFFLSRRSLMRSTNAWNEHRKMIQLHFQRVLIIQVPLTKVHVRRSLRPRVRSYL